MPMQSKPLAAQVSSQGQVCKWQKNWEWEGWAVGEELSGELLGGEKGGKDVGTSGCMGPGKTGGKGVPAAAPARQPL